MAQMGPGQRLHRLTSFGTVNSALDNRFPKLNDGNNSVESPRSRQYNCIAWACGVNTLRYWPDHPDMDWPSTLPDIGDGLDAFEALFESLGYEPCDSADLEPEFEKIAIYTYDDGEPSHAARQVESGRWTSKMGLWAEDIEHDTLDDVTGEGAYGNPSTIMRRPRAT